MLGCSDAAFASMGSLGESHKITLYSGGKIVREWISTGKIENETSSDGFYFRDKSTGKLVRVTGDVVIERL